jgi:hypothetical protein
MRLDVVYFKSWNCPDKIGKGIMRTHQRGCPNLDRYGPHPLGTVRYKLTNRQVGNLLISEYRWLDVHAQKEFPYLITRTDFHKISHKKVGAEREFSGIGD